MLRFPVVPLGKGDPVEIVASQDMLSQPFVLKEINLDRTKADDDGLDHLAGWAP